MEANLSIFLFIRETNDASGRDPVKSISIGVPEIPTAKFASDHLCTICPKPGCFQCSACKAARYCSRECQKIDRPTHKIFCKSFNSFTTNDRPSPLHIRGIFFPEDKEKPEWTWILMSEDRTTISVPHLYEGLPTDGLTRDVETMFIRSCTTRDPQNWLTGILRHQPSRGESASSINKSLLGLGPPGHLATYWGPLLMVSNMPVRAGSIDDANSVAHFQDLEMQDLWSTIALLMYGDKRAPCVVNVPRCPFKSLPGIKMNCVGDRVRFHPDKDPNSDAAIYESVIVPNAEPYPEKSQWPSMLAFMLGLPWLCRVVDNSKDLWAKDSNGRYSEMNKALVANPELGHLHTLLRDIDVDSHDAEIRCTPGVATLGLTLEPGPHFGSVILVHMFGERIHPEHVKMVNMFAQERGFGTYDYQELGVRLTGFHEYWSRKQKENNIPGVDLQGVPSPYRGIGRCHPNERCVENLAQYQSLFKEVEAIMSVTSRPL